MWKWSIMIMDWMIQELELHGNELLTYAIIYASAPPSSNNWYCLGQEHIADMLCVDTNTVCGAIAKLKRKGLICENPNATWGGGKKKGFRCAGREW